MKHISSLEWYKSIPVDRPDEIKLDFAVDLEKIALESGMTRASIARASGVSAARITKALRGDANLTIEMMEKLASSVGRTVTIFLAHPGVKVAHIEVPTPLEDDTLATQPYIAPSNAAGKQVGFYELIMDDGPNNDLVQAYASMSQHQATFDGIDENPVPAVVGSYQIPSLDNTH